MVVGFTLSLTPCRQLHIRQVEQKETGHSLSLRLPSHPGQPQVVVGFTLSLTPCRQLHIRQVERKETGHSDSLSPRSTSSGNGLHSLTHTMPSATHPSSGTEEDGPLSLTQTPLSRRSTSSGSGLHSLAHTMQSATHPSSGMEA